MNIENLIQISETEWEIPRYVRADMRVSVRLFAKREMLKQLMQDRSIDQAINAATLPGLVGAIVLVEELADRLGAAGGGADGENGVRSRERGRKVALW